MAKVLFIANGLQNSTTSISQYFNELLKTWQNSIADVSKKVEFEPIIFSLKSPSMPMGDLKHSNDFKDLEAEAKGLKIYETEKQGFKVYFIEHSLKLEDRNAFHGILYQKYRIKSEKAAHSLQDYDALTAFWKVMPQVAEFIAKRHDIALIDANDWSCFVAGFLTKEKIGKPLVCRFHSGEFGRSLGKPDFNMPQIGSEVAALMEADYIQSISVTETKFEIYNLLPEKRKLVESLKVQTAEKWLEMQKLKDKLYQEFLLFDAQNSQLLTQLAAGITHGIDLEEWKNTTIAQIYQGRGALEKVLPGKRKYVIYIGKAETKLGIDALIKAFAELKSDEIGLVIFSPMNEREQYEYNKRLKEYKIDSKATIYNGWLNEYMKKAVITAADVVALPALYEPFSDLTLQVMAADLACEANDLSGPVLVVGDTGGMTEIISNGFNGFKVPMEEDRFDLKPEYLTRVLELILEDDSIQSRISKGAIETIQKSAFEWQNVLRLIFETYSKAKDNNFKFNKMLLKEIEARVEQ